VTFARRRYFRDNYVYLLAEGDDAALVDPGDAEVALALAAEHGLSPRFILHTHGHHDHVGGTAAVKERLRAVVVGHRADAAGFSPDREVARGELCLGAVALRVHPAPGHTPGSVLYEWQGKLLTGDTLFWGGCGNCRHGGDPKALAETFLGMLSGLEGSLEVNPGHDYAEANLPFVLDLEPGNAAAAQALAAAREAHAAGREPRATRLAQERLANPFLRAATAEVRAALARKGVAAADATGAFLALRRLRDAW
jgi:hydroxyacylglutathione hydrolase